MQEVFSKIIERLESVEKVFIRGNSHNVAAGIRRAIEIVKQTAEEYNNGWIPVSVRLPDEAYGCLVTVMDCEPSTQTDFENILPYFVGYDGETWNDADGEEIPFEVIAWQPLPEQYKPKGE